jgi:diguanylate cyclase (GGDEF)-like protein/PAS domain S-box-containing protein
MGAMNKPAVQPTNSTPVGDITSPDASQLRQSAEQRLAEVQLSAAQLTAAQKARARKLAAEQQTTARDLADTQASAQKLLHELQVHQIELEMQNEALQEARTTTELALERYAELFDFAPIAYFTLAPDGIIRQTNFRGEKLLGLDRLKLSGTYFTHSVSPEYRRVFIQFMDDVFAGDGTRRCEISMQIGGRLCWVSIESTADSTRQTCLAAILDITEMKRAEAIILEQATTDALTGLPNRRMFLDRLRQAINKSHREGRTVALLFLDLDHFKDINDTLGHETGDLLLKETAHRLQACVRETDTLARPGGDEFTVIMSQLEGLRSIDRVALSILQAMQVPFQLGHECCYVSFSIGIALYPEDATDLADLLKKADQAMYVAKEQGRNRFCYFTPAMQQAAESRLRLVNDLHTALARRQFWVAYQPIVDLATGDIHKAEALLRWQHPTLGLISPAEFIPVAEDTGMIVEIGEWVFQQAAGQVGEWRADGQPLFQISVNKSPAQFRNSADSRLNWFDYLKQLGLPGSCIAVEITEGLLLDVSPAVAEKLLAFRDAGMQVSLDDFGTGYSSLSYLKKFDIDYLKIDQNFVSHLTDDSTDLALCEAIILMAHKLGIKVIGEGIETVEQRDLLIRAGCDYGQGYLFSRPVSAQEFGKFF